MVKATLRAKTEEVQERVGSTPSPPPVLLHGWMGTNIERARGLHLKAQEAIKHEDSDGGAVRSQEREGTCKGTHRRAPNKLGTG